MSASESLGRQWFHGTNADLQPGEHLRPGMSQAHGENHSVWVASNAYAAGKYGQNLYEVEPHTPPKHRYKGNAEAMTTGATIKRTVGNEEYLAASNAAARPVRRRR